VEISLDGSLDDDSERKVQKAMEQTVPGSLVSQIMLDAENRLLRVRALNAVGTLPAILSALETTGLKVSEVRVRENTLEDVFIQLTGRRLRE
jgi:ABC-2 type transport system ATP-binding protein